MGKIKAELKVASAVVWNGDRFIVNTTLQNLIRNTDWIIIISYH